MPAKAIESRLVVRAEASAMREVDGFVAAFVREQRLAADEAPRILILLEESLTNLVGMDIAIERSRDGPK